MLPEKPHKIACVIGNGMKFCVGNAYAWWQNDLPAGFGMDTLGPIYELYAKGVKGATGGIDKAEFIAQVTAAIEALGE